MSNYLQKRLMALAGIFWIIYLIMHMLINLNFLNSSSDFNDFYNWFDKSQVLNYLLTALLISSFLLHIVVAISRKLSNINKRDINYKKSYPLAVPSFAAWGGAFILLIFIVFHFIQMQLLTTTDYYQEIYNIFKSPLSLIIYSLGFMTLTAHLHHSLNNVLKTLGVSSKNYNKLIVLFLIILIGGFASVPISVYL